MQFITSFFNGATPPLLHLKKRRSTAVPLAQCYSELGVLAILTKDGQVYLQTNDACSLLTSLQQTNVTSMHFISNYLWIIGHDIRIYDILSATITSILPYSLSTFQGINKGIVVYDDQVKVYSSEGLLENTFILSRNILSFSLNLSFTRYLSEICKICE